MEGTDLWRMRLLFPKEFHSLVKVSFRFAFFEFMMLTLKEKKYIFFFLRCTCPFFSI